MLLIWTNFRQEFFKSFYDLLSFQPEVADLRAIEETYVPIIKFRLVVWPCQ
jgi:poly(A) polymerase Pap1